MCMVDYNDDPATELAKNHPVARKQHKCSECRRIIQPGEHYLNERIAYDGSCSTYKTCSHCEVARTWLARQCGGWIFGSVAEDIHEHASERRYGFGVKKLSIGIGRKWTRVDGTPWPVPNLTKAA